jgi:hypothetical protein
MAEYLEGIIERYRARYGRHLTLDDVRNRFLTKPPDSATVFLLVYVVARLWEFEGLPLNARSSTFAAQLEEDILFDLALVIDSAIALHDTAGSTFREHGAFLASRASLPLTVEDLGAINADFKTDFDGTLQKLLDSKYTGDGGSINQASTAIAISYGIRNKRAHKVQPSSVVGRQFVQLRDAMFACLFLVVLELY